MPGLIVHEWFEQFGGAEAVVEEIASVFPDAAIACLWNDYPARFADRTVRESWLSKTPLRRHKSMALPFTLAAWRSLVVEAVPDWILCSSHLFAHHAKVQGAPREIPKYVYAYTPARYIWNPELDQRGNSKLARALSKPLKKLDRVRAQEATSLAAVSQFVRSRIEDAWMRDCAVIYPPVDVAYYSSSREKELTEAEREVINSLPETFVLGASRFIPYKRLDLVIEFGATSRIPVVIAGAGPEEKSLRKFAASAAIPVQFVSKPSQALLREIYARALAYIFPPVEDFGIMPVEAAATGTPVVANAMGGAAETVTDGVSGLLLEGFSTAAMRTAARNLSSLRPIDCQAEAEKFDRLYFRESIGEWVNASRG